MKKIFFLASLIIFYIHNLSAQNININSAYFAKDKELIKIINNNMNKGEPLQKKINYYFLQQGYIFSKVNTIIRTNNTVFIDLEEGRIRDIQIIGDAKHLSNIIKTYLYFNKGDILNKNKLRLQIKKLYDTKIFDIIRYDLFIQEKKVVIKMVVKKKRYFEIDGNYTEQYGVMPYLGFIDRDLLNTRIFMNMNIDLGFWERLNYIKFGSHFLVDKFSFDFFYKKGKRFIGDKSYSSEEEKLVLGRNMYKQYYYSLFLSIPFEHYLFYDVKQFQTQNMISGYRYGFNVLFHYSNRRDVLENREETFYTLETSTMIFNGHNSYLKISSEFKGYKKLLFSSGFIFKNVTEWLLFDKPFDKYILIGGIHQKGYEQGEYVTDFKIDNGIEWEYEILFNILKLSVFTDTTYFKNQKDYKFILSYGPGIILNLFKFNMQLYYGVSTRKDFLSGNFYLNASKRIY